jgi:hypothetical protein
MMPWPADSVDAAKARKLDPLRAHSSRKILHYRNPMGLPNTSSVPK